MLRPYLNYVARYSGGAVPDLHRLPYPHSRK